jgi:hypothetical protein
MGFIVTFSCMQILWSYSSLKIRYTGNYFCVSLTYSIVWWTVIYSQDTNTHFLSIALIQNHYDNLILLSIVPWIAETLIKFVVFVWMAIFSTDLSLPISLKYFCINSPSFHRLKECMLKIGKVKKISKLFSKGQLLNKVF